MGRVGRIRHRRRRSGRSASRAWCIAPNVIIGDMDSMTGQSRERFEVLARRRSQRDRLRQASAMGATAGLFNFTLASIEGDLIDHMWRPFRAASHSAETMRIALRRGVGWVFRGPLQINVDPRRRVSLIPLTPARASGSPASSGGSITPNSSPADSEHFELGNDGFVQASIIVGSGFLFADTRARRCLFGISEAARVSSRRSITRSSRSFSPRFWPSAFPPSCATAAFFQFLTAGDALLPAFVATLVTVWYGGILGVAESVTWFGSAPGSSWGALLRLRLRYATWFAKRVRGAEQISIPERLHFGGERSRH